MNLDVPLKKILEYLKASSEVCPNMCPVLPDNTRSNIISFFIVKEFNKVSDYLCLPPPPPPEGVPPPLLLDLEGAE